MRQTTIQQDGLAENATSVGSHGPRRRVGGFNFRVKGLGLRVACVQQLKVNARSLRTSAGN